jgi:hypothetical protein
MKKCLIIAATAALASLALAEAPPGGENRNAFKMLDSWQDIYITQVGDLTWELRLGMNPTVTFNGRTNEVKDVTGFWLLSDAGDIRGVQVAKPDWNTRSNNAPQGNTSAYGWETQTKNGLRPGDSTTFTFSSANLANLDWFGLKLHANGTPAHVVVPEPASMLALAVGAAVVARRRRNKK